MDEFLPSFMWLTKRKEILWVFYTCIGEYLSHSDYFGVDNFELEHGFEYFLQFLLRRLFGERRDQRRRCELLILALFIIIHPLFDLLNIFDILY